MDNTLLYKKFENLPDSIKAQVLDFIDFLSKKNTPNSENQSGGRPKFGSGKGMFKIKKGFDDPIADFSEYM